MRYLAWLSWVDTRNLQLKHIGGDDLWDHCVIEESSWRLLPSVSSRRPDCKEARWPLLPRQRLWRKRRSGCCGGATLCWRGWSTTAREPCRSWAARVTVPVPTVPAGTSARRATAVGRPAAAPITTSCGVSAVSIRASRRLNTTCASQTPRWRVFLAGVLLHATWNALRGEIRQRIRKHGVRIRLRWNAVYFHPAYSDSVILQIVRDS